MAPSSVISLPSAAPRIRTLARVRNVLLRGTAGLAAIFLVLYPGSNARAQDQAPPQAQTQPLAPGKGPAKFSNLAPADRAFVEDLERRTFDWFWETANPENGLIPDRAPLPEGAASIASVGFGLTAYGIGVDQGYITRQQAAERTLRTLRFLLALPQNDSALGAAGYRGFFYHFLNPHTGLRFADWSELSSVDTALLMVGVLFSQSYFDQENAQEQEIRRTAVALYGRVDWPWMEPHPPLLNMGWSPTPTPHFLSSEWSGYNEGLILYLLALGSPTHPLPASTWQAWTATFAGQWKTFEGHEFLNFAPLFGHQYSESWIDFRDLQDDFNRQHHNDYFSNGRKAAYAQLAYARRNPGHWKDYGATLWGLTASDGPGEGTRWVDGVQRHFMAYNARGAGADYVSDDGTIAPTAAGGSIAFAPEIALPTLEDMKAHYGKRIYNRYGFVDAFNPSYVTPEGFWADPQQIGIDQGPILLMIANWRNGFVWNVMKRNPVIQAALKKAGFQGGWLDQTR
ncbi:glucoamylase family protein [Oecophyllibacter saccharovorans]|uniref:glucoamylase family protein n=1 Tax=Oecophyllibacter saccharovorans TaxID=2558360 RepID=UPI001170546C|nr:glucoamylase family protein [Oecophyllibacter saccharovorans]TPW34879.1 Tat pathway signal protein [Oecophyllibacter saccharovorans]